MSKMLKMLKIFIRGKGAADKADQPKQTFFEKNRRRNKYGVPGFPPCPGFPHGMEMSMVSPDLPGFPRNGNEYGVPGFPAGFPVGEWTPGARPFLLSLAEPLKKTGI